MGLMQKVNKSPNEVIFYGPILLPTYTGMTFRQRTYTYICVNRLAKKLMILLDAFVVGSILTNK